MSRYHIPDTLVEEAPEDVEDLLTAEAEEAVEEPVPEAPEELMEENLPTDRPLAKDEVIMRTANFEVVNRAAPASRVRLYDAEGYPRLVLRELTPFALTMATGTGERAFYSRPPKEPQTPKIPCPAPRCKKLLWDEQSRDAHVRAYHQWWWQEQEERRKRRELKARKRQSDAMVALLGALVRKEVPEVAETVDEGIQPPSPAMARHELLGYLKQLTNTWNSEWMSLTKEALFELASVAYGQVTGLETDMDADVVDDDEEEL